MEIFVNMGPHGSENFKNSTASMVIILFQPYVL